MNNKHAFLIIAHNQFDILEKLIIMLDDDRNDIFLHIDKRVEHLDKDCYLALVKHSDLHFTKRMAVYWGHSSQVDCELLLLGECLKYGPYQYVHLLSGVDLPIKTQDEIHRFSKSQQDSLLGAVEKGIVTLIGATTENPSFEVIRPLLSRCQLYVLKSLEKEDLLKLLHRAVTEDVFLKERKIELKETDALLRYSGGDARKLLNIIELVVEATEKDDTIIVTNQLVAERLQQNPLAYDKDGEMHYDIISAFIKSIRGSDPDAALYWLARMIEGGEDPKFIARRLVISAAEDIGLANPNALLLANAAFDAVEKIGWPEGRIPLAEATVYLATSPKSNSAYLGIDSALELVRRTGNQPVPLAIRNAPTQLMKELGYHDGYQYPHDFPGHFTPQQYLPDSLIHERIWHGQHSPNEEKLYERMLNYWGERFKE